MFYTLLLSLPLLIEFLYLLFMPDLLDVFQMKIQGRLMQARFIEIHQVFQSKIVGYFSNSVVICLQNI